MDCHNIMEEIKEQLKIDFQVAGSPAHTLASTGDLLLQLNEQPSELAKGMLHSASNRLHQQIVMLQVNCSDRYAK